MYPNFLIVGSAKCGTTALASILSSHPDCCMSDPKEVSFFQDTINFEPNPNFEKGRDWYRQAFSHFNGESFVGEATPSYSDRSRSPETAKRIYEFNRDMKIIFLVRDPWLRQVSAWKMQWTMAKAKVYFGMRELDWALEGFEIWMWKQKEVNQWDECNFDYQLNAYTEYFAERNIHVAFLEDWAKDERSEIKAVCEFLGLDFGAIDLAGNRTANRASHRSIERPGLKKIRTNLLVSSITSILPMSLRDYARRKIAHSKPIPPVVDSNAKLEGEFYSYLNDSTKNFLIDRKKTPEIWPEFHALSK